MLCNTRVIQMLGRWLSSKEYWPLLISVSLYKTKVYSTSFKYNRTMEYALMAAKRCVHSFKEYVVPKKFLFSVSIVRRCRYVPNTHRHIATSSFHRWHVMHGTTWRFVSIPSRYFFPRLQRAYTFWSWFIVMQPFNVETPSFFVNVTKSFDQTCTGEWRMHGTCHLWSKKS